MTLEEMIAEERMRRMVMGVAGENTAPVGRNLLEPHIPGTRAWAAAPSVFDETIPGTNLPAWMTGFMQLPIAYHSSPWPIEGGIREGFHAGSRRSALERLYDVTQGQAPSSRTGVLYKVNIKPKNPYPMMDERGLDSTTLFTLSALKSEREGLRQMGYDVVPYINAIEGRGTKSYLVLDPDIVKVIGEEQVSVGALRRGPKKGWYDPSKDPSNWGKTVPIGKGVKTGKKIKGKLGQPIPAGE